MLKDMISSITNEFSKKMRSPHIGSFIFFNIALNWNQYALLLWGEGEVSKRIQTFEQVIGLKDFLFEPLMLTALYVVINPIISAFIHSYSEFVKINTKGANGILALKSKRAFLKRELIIKRDIRRTRTAEYSDLLKEIHKQESSFTSLLSEEDRERLITNVYEHLNHIDIDILEAAKSTDFGRDFALAEERKERDNKYYSEKYAESQLADMDKNSTLTEKTS